jgi:hypothetical protein
MAEVMLHSMHLSSDLLEAVVDALELHSGFAKLFILAPLKGVTTIVEFSTDLPMIPPCHVLCVFLLRWHWLGRLAIPVHDAKPQGLYMEEKHGELAFYLTLEIVSNQLPHKRAKSLQSEIAKRLTHKELHSQKILVERRVESQRTNQTKRIVKSGEDPTKLKSKGNGQLKR